MVPKPLETISIYGSQIFAKILDTIIVILMCELSLYSTSQDYMQKCDYCLNYSGAEVD